MDGKQAIEYIHSLYGQGKKRGLENGFAMMEQLDGPDKKMKCIHVAGTNGKGSICAYIESVLRTQGYKTGLYTSPYLQTYNERIRIDGAPVSDDALAKAVVEVKSAVDALRGRGILPTEFEVGTAAAFVAFANAQVDYAIIEVGIGGRLDTTNVITPAISVIGSIGLDHEKILGDTVEQIAAEKAGIIKPGVPVMVYPQQESVRRVIEDIAKRQNAPITFVEESAVVDVSLDMHGANYSFMGKNIRVNIPGKHQIYNSAAAIAALSVLCETGVDISEVVMIQGIRDTRWAGRLEWVGENVVIDGAHNPQGARAMAEYAAEFFAGKKVAVVFGVLQKKEYHGITQEIAKFAACVFAVEPDAPKPLSAQEVVTMMGGFGVEAKAFGNLKEAVDVAKAFAGADGYVVIMGSLYLAGEARSLLMCKTCGETCA